MAAANFEDTAVYRLWSQDVEFKQNQEFSRSLRFNQHQNGHLITIHYGTNAQWSKKRAEAASGACDSQNTRDRLIQATKQLFGDETFLWQANKSMQTIRSDPTASDCPISRMGSTPTQKFIILRFCLLSILRPITSSSWRREGLLAAMFDAPSTSRPPISQ